MDKFECQKTNGLGNQQRSLEQRNAQRLDVSRRTELIFDPKWGELGYVYLIKDAKSREVRYVGKTEDLYFRRLADHFRFRETAANPNFQEWLKANKENVVIEMIPYPKHLTELAERRLIKYYLAADNRLFNLVIGGEARFYGFNKVSSRCNPTKSRPCCKVNYNTGQVIECYNSVTEASVKNNIELCNIYAVMRGNRTKAGGYAWIPN